MGNGPNIGKRLQLGNLGFQGIILLLMFAQTFVQRNAFFDNACQLSVPVIKLSTDRINRIFLCFAFFYPVNPAYNTGNYWLTSIYIDF